MSDTVSLMHERLAALSPSLVEIDDESARHAGHAGARDGGHYRLTIVSSAFTSLGRVARHRLVYDTLGDMMQGRIHALAISAHTPDESTPR